MLGLFKLNSILGLLMTVILVSGCAPNNLSIRLAYSRLDDSIFKNINSYADFDKPQQSWIRTQSRNYQLWLRKDQLPIYSDLLDNLALDLVSEQPFSTDQVRLYFDQLSAFAVESFTHLPLSQSVELLKTLTDIQIREIESHMQEKNAKQIQIIKNQDDTGNNEDRIDRINKTISRIGLSFNQEQREIVDDGMQRYVGNRVDRIHAWEKWEMQFISLLETRENTDFSSRMKSHIATYQTQMEIQFPQRSRQNTETAIDTITALLNSLTDTQRTTIIQNLKKTSRIFMAMANSKQTTIL